MAAPSAPPSPAAAGPRAEAKVKTLAAALALLGAVLILSACGSGEGGSTSSTSVATTGQSTPAAQQPSRGRAGSPQGQGVTKPKQSDAAAKDTSAGFHPKPHHDSGGGGAQFERKGGDNSIQESGSEARGSEFDQAAAALHGYLDARAAGAWSAACTYLAPGLTDSLAQLTGAGGSGAKPSCPQLLATLSTGLPPAALREAAIADVGALRVKGKSAFLLFKGAHGSAYFMPMARAGGEWKVAAIAASALP
jgi:hypothetical protein